MTNEIIYFGHPIPLNDMASVWIGQYRENRYLRKLRKEELTNRASDIAQNLTYFDEETGKYKPNFHLGHDGIYKPVRNLDWLKLATEVHEEFRMRGMKISALPSQATTTACEIALSKEDWAKRPDLIQASKPSLSTYEIPNLLFRYSKNIFNEEFLNCGRLRVTPASTYNDGSHNRARQDNEKVMEVAESGGYAETDDFYTVCFSAIYSYRMYCEFGSDSCVVIKHIPRFQERFNNAVKHFNKASGGLRIAEVRTCPVIYFDPFNIESPTTVDEIFLSKPFRFAYQHEFRLVLLPTKPQPLEVFFLELGPLNDIAELVSNT